MELIFSCTISSSVTNQHNEPTFNYTLCTENPEFREALMNWSIQLILQKLKKYSVQNIIIKSWYYNNANGPQQITSPFNKLKLHSAQNKKSFSTPKIQN